MFFLNVMLPFLGTVAVVIVVAAVICLGIILFASSTVIFSRVAFPLFMAALLDGRYPIIPSSKFLNYILWAAILLGLMYLLSLLPRVGCALKFFCTAILSYFVIELLGVAIMSLILGETFQVTTTIEIIIKVVCTVLSFVALYKEITRGEYGTLSNPILINLERILASLLYGITITFMCALAMNSLWVFPAIVNWSIFIGTIVLTFAADIFLSGQGVKG